MSTFNFSGSAFICVQCYKFYSDLALLELHMGFDAHRLHRLIHLFSKYFVSTYHTGHCSRGWGHRYDHDRESS